MSHEPSYSTIEVKLDFIRRDIDDIKKRLDDNYVTDTEFEPVKKIVYGLVSLVLVAVVGAVIALIIQS